MYDAKNWRVKRQQWIMRSSKDEEVHDDKAWEDNGNMGRSEIQRMGGKMGRWAGKRQKNAGEERTRTHIIRKMKVKVKEEVSSGKTNCGKWNGIKERKMDRNEINREERWEKEERKLRGHRAYNGLKGTCWCVKALDPTPPLGKKGERRDTDLALFMLSAIGPGRRCFPLCLHNEELLWSWERGNTTRRPVYVNVCLCGHVCAFEVGGHCSVAYRQVSEQGSQAQKNIVCNGMVQTQAHHTVWKGRVERITCHFLGTFLPVHFKKWRWKCTQEMTSNPLGQYGCVKALNDTFSFAIHNKSSLKLIQALVENSTKYKDLSDHADGFPLVRFLFQSLNSAAAIPIKKVINSIHILQVKLNERSFWLKLEPEKFCFFSSNYFVILNFAQTSQCHFQSTGFVIKLFLWFEKNLFGSLSVWL